VSQIRTLSHLVGAFQNGKHYARLQNGEAEANVVTQLPDDLIDIAGFAEPRRTTTPCGRPGCISLHPVLNRRMIDE
jgi:hypothetical protein